jgi:broad specificity phosphatase PhoE
VERVPSDTPRPELWICRHGETEWSRSGRHTSRTDVPLVPEGAERARKMAARLAGVGFDLVLASPKRRARDTAALAGHPEAEVSADVAEWDYGEYEGLTTPKIRETVPGWTIWSHPAPGGETAEQVGERADRVVDRVRSSAATRALVFSHGHFLRVLGARWIGLPPASGGSFRLDTGTLSVLGWERETPAFVRWNVP